MVAENKQPDELHDLIWPAEAAKRLHKHPNFIRKFIRVNGLGVKWGGTATRPRLKVCFSELAEKLLKNRYQPPNAPKRQKPKRIPRPAVGEIQDVRC